MVRKTIALITLFCFMVAMCSCYATRVERIENSIKRKSQVVKVLAVYDKDGKWWTFAKPGKIRMGAVTGSIWDQEGKLKYFSIPIKDVQVVKIKYMDKVLYPLFGLSVIIVVPFLAFLLAVSLTKEYLCPYVYSFDGENYVMEAEPFAGRICKGLEKTEWKTLDYIKEVDGQYRLLVANEVDEADYLDELSLLVVDHDPLVKVVPGVDGTLHTLSKPILPERAYDRQGNDLTGQLGKQDHDYWQTQDDAVDIDNKESLRHELIFEFHRPVDAKQATLVFAGCNTPWAAGTLNRYLELHGDEAPLLYREMQENGPALQKMQGLFDKEEIYAMQLRVLTEKGWENRGLIEGAPPLVPATRAYKVDLSGVTGDTLKMKLTPPAASWMIDYLALDYSSSLPLHVSELKPQVTLKGDQKEIGKQLAEKDGNYYSLSPQGAWNELRFTAPPQKQGKERTIILKAGGYYHIHLEGKGKSQKEFIQKLHTQSGTLIQFIYRHYQEKRYFLEKQNLINCGDEQ